MNCAFAFAQFAGHWRRSPCRETLFTSMKWLVLLLPILKWSMLQCYGRSAYCLKHAICFSWISSALKTWLPCPGFEMIQYRPEMKLFLKFFALEWRPNIAPALGVVVIEELDRWSMFGPATCLAKQSLPVAEFMVHDDAAEEAQPDNVYCWILRTLKKTALRINVLRPWRSDIRSKR